MTADELAPIRARRAAIAPTPWRYTTWGGTAPGNVLDAHSDDIVDLYGDHPDGEFIAHAPTDIDRLLAEVDSLRGLLGRLEWSVDQHGGGDACPVCSNRERDGHGPGCELAAVLVDGPARPADA